MSRDVEIVVGRDLIDAINNLINGVEILAKLRVVGRYLEGINIIDRWEDFTPPIILEPLKHLKDIMELYEILEEYDE